ncbi:Lcl C-terminal domain-containing protein [Hydrogenophaga soli]
MRTHLATLALLAAALPAWAGSLDAPAAPASGSGMPSTTDIYNRLDTGATVSVPGTFQEPAAGPTAGTGRTLADIAAKLPVPDNTQGAAAGDVANGKTFWGLRTDGTWGPRTGTAAAATPASGNATAADVLTGKTFSNSSANGVAGSMADNGAVNITPGTAAQTIPAGYHNGAGSVAGDANLVSGNIKSGVSIFGVNGSSSVVDTAGATAVTADIAAGKTVYVNGAMVTGTGTLANGAYYPIQLPAICLQGWGGSACRTPCANGLMGTNCDILSEPYAGTLPTYASTPWNCVHDTSTGLVWEVKLPDTGAGTVFRGLNETFSWYSNDAYPPGTANGGTCKKTGRCDTEKYTAAVNATQLCGFTDWRMPTQYELVAVQSNISNNPDYFPNTLQFGTFWSGVPVIVNPTSVWSVSGTGITGWPASNTFSIRLVRGKP